MFAGGGYSTLLLTSYARFPFDRCHSIHVQPCAPSKEEEKKVEHTSQALRSLIPTLRAKVDVMPSGSFAAWYARFSSPSHLTGSHDAALRE